MKRAFAILLCLMLTGCIKTVPLADSSRLTATTAKKAESTVSNTEPTTSEMTEEKTVQTVRVTTPEKSDAPAVTERTEAHRTTESTATHTARETVRETQVSKVTVTDVTAADSNPLPVTSSQTSSTTATVQTTAQSVTIGTTAADITTITTTTETTQPFQTRYDLSRIPMQIQIFMEEYEIDADALFAIGTEIGGTEYERACAAAQTAQQMGGRNCIEHALNAYFIAEGAGLTVGIARSTLYDWYGHVANAVMLDGAWYYMEPQGGLAELAQTYANGYYPDGLDAVTDIYGNQLPVSINTAGYE